MELFAAMDDGYVEIYGGLEYQLDLPESKVAEIKRNYMYHGPFQRRNAYLDLYATCHPCPSWRQIAEVLRFVDLDHQADVVESTYVQGTIIKKYMYILISFFIGGMRSGWGAGHSVYHPSMHSHLSCVFNVEHVYQYGNIIHCP